MSLNSNRPNQALALKVLRSNIAVFFRETFIQN